MVCGSQEFFIVCTVLFFAGWAMLAALGVYMADAYDDAKERGPHAQSLFAWSAIVSVLSTGTFLVLAMFQLVPWQLSAGVIGLAAAIALISTIAFER